jgi:hypothetical protein
MLPRSNPKPRRTSHKEGRISMLISATISGIKPLMLDRFHNALLEGRAVGQSSNKHQEPSPLEQAQARLFLIDDDPKKPYLPTVYLLRSIIDAGRFVKVGRRQLSTRDETIVTSFLSIVEESIPIKSIDGWRVDARGVVNQAKKARVMAYRPIFDDWELTFTIDLDETQGREDVCRELVDRAGRAIGIGVMRPSRKGALGQWKVIKWGRKDSEVKHVERKKERA